MTRVGLRAAAGLLVVALTVVGPLADPSAPGPEWDGDGADGHGLLVAQLHRARPGVLGLEASLRLLPSDAGAPGDVIFVLATHREPQSGEVRELRRFVDRGGLAVIAVDGGHASTWLRGLGIDSHAYPILPPQGDREGCVVAYVAIDGVNASLCLPSPTAFPDLAATADGGPIKVLSVAHSRDDVFIDLDGDGKLSLSDQGPQPYAVAVEWQLGAGRAIAIADDDLWRNQLVRDDARNLEFAAALVRSVPGDGHTYVDGTSGPSTGSQVLARPYQRSLAAPGMVETAALLFVIAGVVVLAAASARVTPWRRHEPTGFETDGPTEQEAYGLIAATLSIESKKTSRNQPED